MCISQLVRGVVFPYFLHGAGPSAESEVSCLVYPGDCVPLVPIPVPLYYLSAGCTTTTHQLIEFDGESAVIPPSPVTLAPPPHHTDGISIVKLKSSLSRTPPLSTIYTSLNSKREVVKTNANYSLRFIYRHQLEYQLGPPFVSHRVLLNIEKLVKKRGTRQLVSTNVYTLTTHPRPVDRN